MDKFPVEMAIYRRLSNRQDEFGNDLYRNESIHSRNQAIAPQSS
ncbi:MAG: hypothetical protein V7K69_15250 [Nostoc sp.]